MDESILQDLEGLDQRADRAWRALLGVRGSEDTRRDLARHINLRALLDTNEVSYSRWSTLVV